jgi:hypothetical protein
MYSRQRHPCIFLSSITASYEFVLLCLVLAACSSSPPIDPTPLRATVTPTSTSTPLSTPIPDIDLSISEVQWVLSPASHQWGLIGKVVNLEDYPVEGVQLTVTLVENNSSSSLSPMASTIPTVIQPAAEAVFQILIPDSSGPTEYQISYSAQRSDINPPTSIQVEINEWRERSDGRLEGLGEVENRGDHLVNLQAVYLLLYDEMGLPLGVAVSDHLLPILAPQSSNPFSVSFETFVQVDSWDGYVDASAELLPPNSPLNLVNNFKLERTQQGGFYYLGEIENEGVTPWWVVLNITFEMDEVVFGLDTIHVPFPILPSQRLPFVIDPSSLPPELLTSIDSDLLEVQVLLDPWKTLPTLDPWISIPVNMTQIEQIGSRLYFRGGISNSTEGALSESVVLLRILDVNGRTRATGWTTPLGSLDQEGTVTFDLSVLVPAGLDLNMLEFDVLAYGSPVKDE